MVRYYNATLYAEKVAREPLLQQQQQQQQVRAIGRRCVISFVAEHESLSLRCCDGRRCVIPLLKHESWLTDPYFTVLQQQQQQFRTTTLPTAMLVR